AVGVEAGQGLARRRADWARAAFGPVRALVVWRRVVVAVGGGRLAGGGAVGRAAFARRHPAAFLRGDAARRCRPAGAAPPAGERDGTECRGYLPAALECRDEKGERGTGGIGTDAARATRRYAARSVHAGRNRSRVRARSGASRPSALAEVDRSERGA